MRLITRRNLIWNFFGSNGWNRVNRGSEMFEMLIEYTKDWSLQIINEKQKVPSTLHTPKIHKCESDTLIGFQFLSSPFVASVASDFIYWTTWWLKYSELLFTLPNSRPLFHLQYTLFNILHTSLSRKMLISIVGWK